MAKHYVVDIETLSTTSQAVVLSIGAVEFDVKSGKIVNEFYQELRLEDQTQRKIDVSTVRWWANQVANHPERATVFTNTNRCPVRNALVLLIDFLGGREITSSPRCIWACDPDFDLAILGTLYQEYNLPTPWAYFEGKSIRTIRQLTKDLFGEVEFEKTHNALEDCIRQAKEVMHFYKQVEELQ